MSVERDTAQLLTVAARLWRQRYWTLAQYVRFQQACVQYVIHQQLRRVVS